MKNKAANWPRFLKDVRFPNLLLCLTLLGVTPEPVAAGGYEIQGHSAYGVGVAQAGAVAGYGDGSESFSNPAALSALEKPTFSIGGHWVPINVEFKDRGSTVIGMPNRGDDSGEHPVNGFVPNLYLATPLGENLGGGLFLTSPYGLATSYRRDWVGRYQAVDSSLTTVQTGASLGYALVDNFSLGGGLSALYGEGELSNMVDFGTIGTSLLGPATAQSLGLTPQGNDGYADIKGHDWNLRWQVGALYRYGDAKQNRLGISYRGKSTLRLHGGSATFEVPDSATPLLANGAFSKTSARAELPLPEAINFGAIHWLNDQWAVLYQSEWTRWSRVQDLTVKFGNPAQPTAQERFGWRNSWHHAIGVRHDPCADWQLRAGFQYDRTPVPGAALRSPRLPDADQYWLTLGSSYQVTDSLRVDLSYAYVFFAKGRSQRTGASGDVLAGEWHNAYNALSGALVWGF